MIVANGIPSGLDGARLTEPRPARLRILYHHRTQGRGAEGNHIVSIVSALRALGHHVDVLSPPGVDPFDVAGTIPVDKAATATQGWSSVWKLVSRRLPNWLFEIGEIAFNLPAYFRLRRALRLTSYDLVYERYAFYLLAGMFAAREAGCRFVLEVNELSGVPDRARHQSFPILCGWFEKRLLPGCDMVHAVSSYLADRALAQSVEPSHLIMVPNGFNVVRIRLTRERSAMRERLGFTDDDVVIGFAGWFDRWDRLDFLVRVFAALRQHCPRSKLCLVGDGPAAKDARLQIEKAGLTSAVMMTGAVERGEVYNHIQIFDIGILPHSNIFGSPIVMFEIMGLGIPLVAPKLPPIIDVHPRGDTALLFEPLNLADCVTQLTVLVDSPCTRSEIAARAMDRMIQNHSWEETARRILAGIPD